MLLMIEILHDLIWTSYTEGIGVLVVSYTYIYIHIHIYIYVNKVMQDFYHHQ